MTKPFSYEDAIAPAAPASAGFSYEEASGKKPKDATLGERVGYGVKRALSATQTALTDDPTKIAKQVAETAAEAPRQSAAAAQMLADIKPYVDAANKAEGVVDTVKSYGILAAKRAGQLISNPGEAGKMIAEQLPNSLPGMAGGIAGAKGGAALLAPLGPWGAAAGAVGGGIIGGLAGGYLTEKGSSVQEQVQKKAQEAGVNIQDQSAVSELVRTNQPEIEKAAALKGIGTAGTDAVLNVLTVGLSGMGRRMLGKEISALAGAVKAGQVSAADAAKSLAALEAKAVAQGSWKQVLGRGAAVTTAEMLGEGFSEGVGQKLAYGSVDAGEVVDESLLGLGQGVGMAAASGAYNKLAGTPDQNTNLQRIEALRNAIGTPDPNAGQPPAQPPAPAAEQPPAPFISPDEPVAAEPPPVVTPSEAMGIDPNAGAISRVAAEAVDGPASMEMAAQQANAAIAAEDNPEAGAPADQPVPIEDRPTDELRMALRNAQDPAIRKTIGEELQRRREASAPTPDLFAADQGAANVSNADAPGAVAAGTGGAVGIDANGGQPDAGLLGLDGGRAGAGTAGAPAPSVQESDAAPVSGRDSDKALTPKQQKKLEKDILEGVTVGVEFGYGIKQIAKGVKAFPSSMTTEQREDAVRRITQRMGLKVPESRGRKEQMEDPDAQGGWTATPTTPKKPTNLREVIALKKAEKANVQDQPQAAAPEPAPAPAPAVQAPPPVGSDGAAQPGAAPAGAAAVEGAGVASKKQEFKVEGADPHTVSYAQRPDGRLVRTINYPDGQSSTDTLVTDKKGGETWVSNDRYAKGEFYPKQLSSADAEQAIREDMAGKPVAPTPSPTTTEPTNAPRSPEAAQAVETTPQGREETALLSDSVSTDATDLRDQLRKVEDQILQAVPGYMAQGGGDIDAAMKSRKVPANLKMKRNALKKKLQEQRAASPEPAAETAAPGATLQSAMKAEGWTAEVDSPGNTIWVKRVGGEEYTARMTGASSMEVTVLVNGVGTQIGSTTTTDPKAAAKAASKAVADDVAESAAPAPTQQAQAPAEPQEITHNGTRIYRTRAKLGDEVKTIWAVETPENKARRAAGERTLGGDTLHDTIEQAKAAADREAKQYAERKAFAEQQDAAERARKEADEARKASNRGKSILERRKDAILDGDTKLPASAGLGNTTRRNAMQMAVDQGRAVVERQVDDTAAKKRDQDAIDRVRSAGYMLGLSNENIPVVKAGLEAQARLKANDYKKPEYRVYAGSEPTGGFFEITKIEYEYAQELMAEKAAKPAAAPAVQPTVDQAANEAATSPSNDLPEPTQAQKEAGNYKKGHVQFDGLDLTVENPVGSTRSGTDPSGKPWEVTMTAHYGYHKRTTGADGDQVDVYLADNPVAGSPVFVFDQFNADGSFDEHKAVAGVATEAEAIAIYDAHFSDGSGPKRRRTIKAMTPAEFKAWAMSDAAKQPLASEFIPAPDGGLDYGEITPEMGKAMRRQAGKIRLTRGVQNSNGTGHGLVHIEANHGKDIRALGFTSIEEFVAYVAGGIQQVWQVPGNSQLLVTTKDGRKDVMYIRLEVAKEGDFYRVNSAFPVRQQDYEALHGMKKIWDGSEPTSAVTGQRPAFATAAIAAPDSESSQGSSNARGQADSVAQPIPEAQAETPKLTQAEAKDLMEWQDLGQKDGIKTHILTFYESKADKDAKRGRMVVATVTKEADSKNWVVEGTDDRLAMLAMAKKKAEEAGMARAVADGFVEPAATPMSKYDAEARAYGYQVAPDGKISKGDKALSPVVKEVRGRLRVEAPDGKLLFSGATTPEAFGEFLRSFWGAEKAATGDTPMFSRAKAKEIRNLVTLHNMTEANLEYSDSLGGMPVPSLGITKVDAPFSGFGNITLIGDKNLVDPEQGVPVFDRDAWTARFPTMNFKKPKKAKADAFYERMKAMTKGIGVDEGSFLSNLWESMVNASVTSPDKVAEHLNRYDAPRMAYARDVLGRAIKVPMRDARLSSPAASDKQLQAYWKKNGKRLVELERELSGFDFGSTPEYKAFMSEIEGAIRRYADSVGNAHRADGYVDTFLPGGELGSGGFYRLSKDFEQVGKKEVDGIKLREAVDKVVKSNDPAYLRWVQEQVKPLFDAPTITLRGKEVEPTLDNIVEAMTTGAVQGVEKSMTFGPGKLAAHLGKRFKSLAEIKAARDQVVSESAESEAKKATDALLDEFRTHVAQFFTFKDWRGNIDTWAANDSSMEALARAGKQGLTDANIRLALARKDFKGVDQRGVDLARQAIEALRDTATNYFEAKPQRAVKLNEFKGAVVPKDISPDSLAILEKNGITVEFYGKADGAREKAIEKLAKRLDRQSGDVVFSRAAAAGSMPIQTAQQIVDTIKARWKNAPEVIVLADMNDSRVPEAVRKGDAEQRSGGATGEPEGFYYKGTAYVVAGSLKTPGDVTRVLLHESLGHHGLRGVFGDGLKTILKQIATMRKSEVQAKATEYGLDMEKEADRLQAAEEVLAVMAQNNPQAGFVKRAIGAIRAWLRENIPGLQNMRLTDNDIVTQMILPARRFVQAGPAAQARGGMTAFSKAVQSALEQIAKLDGLFAVAKSDKDTLEGVFADVAPGIVVKKLTNIPGRTQYNLTISATESARVIVRPRNPYGEQLYGYDLDANGEMVGEVVGRPGDNPEDAPEADDVWIDVSLLPEGSRAGELVYQAVATYAHNTGKVFIGDPAGLSDQALRRRTEQMLSSALKHGTTRHIAPHPRQISGDAKLGVPGLQWVYGDDNGNVERMIDVSLRSIENAFPNAKLIGYDSATNQFYRTDTGQRFADRGQLAGLVGQAIARRLGVAGTAGATGQAGWRTVARAALFRDLKARSALVADAPNGRTVLDGLREVGPRLERGEAAGGGEPTKNRIFYSRSGVEPPAAFSRSPRELAGMATDQLNTALKSVTITSIKQAAGYKATDLMGIALGGLGRRQLVEIYGKDLPLDKYNELATQMEADKNEYGAEADSIATEWGKLKDEGALANIMHDATLAKIDPDKPLQPGDDPAAYNALKMRFGLMSKEAKETYRKARDGYKRHHANVREAIKERIERSQMSPERRAALVERMDSEFFAAMKGVYFPLARFGKYVVVVRGADGKVETVARSETMAEAAALRRNLVAGFPAAKGYQVDKVILSREFVASRDAVGRGFMQELYQVLDKQDMDPSMRAEMEDTLGQLYLSSLPDVSWAKHGIHRKGTPGFSQDARRAFAQNMFHGARYLAKLRYSDLMQAELKAMQDHVDKIGNVLPDEDGFNGPRMQRVVDEFYKRHDSLMNPNSHPWSTALTSIGFMFHLGLSPASALVNMTQTALVAYPIMGARWGFGKAGAALLKASKQAAMGRNDITKFLNRDERRAYDQAVKDGTIDVTQAHDLAGIAQGEDAGVMWRIRPAMRAASFLFHHAERFNRQATFVAAYRLAREAGTTHEAAFEQATKATYDGHYDYSAGNRPRFMQGNAAKVILLFKSYAQNMVYTLARNAYQSVNALDPKERVQARKALAGILATHAMAAGVLGLPMVTTILAAISAAGSDDDEPFDAQVALQNMLADTFGQKPAEVITRGLSRLGPWDISGRVGLDRLIFPDIQEGLEGQRLAESAAFAALGPVAGIGLNILKGIQEIGDGHTLRGITTMMPAALRGPLNAVRLSNEGAQDKTGIPIVDEVDAASVFGQALGFSPSVVRQATEGKRAVLSYDRALNERRQELMTQYARGAMKQDAEAMQEARDAIQAFNEKNPGRRITMMQLNQSVRNRERRINQADDGVYLPKNRREAMDQGRFALQD